MKELARKDCVPCEGDFPPLTPEQAKDFMEHVPGWELAEDAKSIGRSYTFKDFRSALAFTNEVGKLAEAEGHHPDIALFWGKVSLTLSTHSVGGLSENDFILAAKINELHD